MKFGLVSSKFLCLVFLIGFKSACVLMWSHLYYAKFIRWQPFKEQITSVLCLGDGHTSISGQGHPTSVCAHKTVKGPETTLWIRAFAAQLQQPEFRS